MLNLVLQNGVSAIASVAQKTTFMAFLCPVTPANTFNLPVLGTITDAAPTQCRELQTLVADWAASYKLTDSELTKIDCVLHEYEVDQARHELEKRLRGVIAARAVATLSTDVGAAYLKWAGLASSIDEAREGIEAINRLSTTHNMTSKERAVLCTTLVDVPESNWLGELSYDAEGIVAGRRIRDMTLPSKEYSNALRTAMAGDSVLPPFEIPLD